MEIVQDSSAEGSQFCKGFGGLGGVLRYPFVVEGEEDSVLGGEEDLSSYFDEPLNEPTISKEKVNAARKRAATGSSSDSAEEETAVW
jgi:hypothetical protein